MAIPADSPRFDHGYDFFQWEAPYYDTPEEGAAALYAARIEGKDLACIHVPGLGTDLKGDRYYMGEKHPFSLWFQEPLQLIFQDGTTMEILPLSNGGARIRVNTLPPGIKSGMNQTSWNLKSLLSLTLFKSKVLHQNAFYVERAQRTAYNAQPGMARGYVTQKKTENSIRIFLNNSQLLELHSEDRGLHSTVQYRLRLLENGEVVQLPTQRWIAARAKGCSIELCPGVGVSSDMKIFPVYSRSPKRDTWCSRKNYLANFALSMDVDECGDYFGTVLRKYFDPAIQTRDEWYSGEAGFDWYGVNLYTMDTAFKLIAEIRQLADRLEKDPNDPELKTLADGFHVMDIDNREYYSGIDEEEVRRRNIRVAVDLYRRFSRSLESMLEAASRDGCDAIEFCGP